MAKKSTSIKWHRSFGRFEVDGKERPLRGSAVYLADTGETAIMFRDDKRQEFTCYVDAVAVQKLHEFLVADLPKGISPFLFFSTSGPLVVCLPSRATAEYLRDKLGEALRVYSMALELERREGNARSQPA